MAETQMPVDPRWKLPLSVDRQALYIWDADGQMVAEIRGWGHLTGYFGGLRLADEDAIEVQKARGEAICRAVNAMFGKQEAPDAVEHAATDLAALVERLREAERTMSEMADAEPFPGLDQAWVQRGEAIAAAIVALTAPPEAHDCRAAVRAAVPAVRRQLITRAAAHRQPPPVARVTGERPWWADAPREGFTSAGERATEQSRHRREVTGIGLSSLLRGE